MTSPEGSPEAVHVMLLEGQNDLHVVRHILELHKESIGFEPGTVFYRDMKGFPELIKGIDNAVDSYERVGIVLDGNADPQDRWAQVAGQLASAGVGVPKSPDPAGTVTTDERRVPRVGVWLMPDNQSVGELENFIYEMIPKSGPDSDRVWPLAQSFISGIPDEHRKFEKEKELKAEVHAWLATRKKPGLMGMAIAAGDLDTKVELCQRFVNWMRRVYE